MKKSKKLHKLQVLKSLTAQQRRGEILKQELLCRQVQSQLLEQEFKEMQNRLAALKAHREHLSSQNEGASSEE